MYIRLMTAFTLGILFAGTYVASQDQKSSNTLESTPGEILFNARLFGSAIQKFEDECQGLWWPSKDTIYKCGNLVTEVHRNCRELSPNKHLKKTLLDVKHPFEELAQYNEKQNGHNNAEHYRKLGNSAFNIIAQQHGLKNPQALYMSFTGYLREYKTKDGEMVIVGPANK